MRRILFQGTTATKVVNHYEHPVVQATVTPLVVIQDEKNLWGDDELCWGMILQCTPQKVLEESENSTSLEPFEIEETFSAWSNPVKWWRALQLIEAMPILSHRNLDLDLWIAAGRSDPDDCFDQEIIEEIRSALGEGHDYQEIMARPVPMDIIQLTIRLIDEGLDMHGVQYELTDEIEVGTIRWSQELKRVEVSHPDYRKATQTARAVVIERYKDHLFSYAAFQKLPYGHDHLEKCFHMLGIENSIYVAIERGIEKQYGMDLVAMIAILYIEIITDEILSNLKKKHPHDHGDHTYVRPTQEERFSQVLAWITHFTPVSIPQEKELNQTLHRLFEGWETMPVIQPLVN